MSLIRHVCVMALLFASCGAPATVLVEDNDSPTSTTTQTRMATSTTTRIPLEGSPPCDFIVPINEGDGDCVWIAEELHLIYAAVAADLAPDGQLHGTLHILDRVVDVAALDERDAEVFTTPGSVLTEGTPSAIIAAVPDFTVDFKPDFDDLRTEQCRLGTPWGVTIFIGLGLVRHTEAGTVEVLLELNDVNGPDWRVAAVERTADGWAVAGTVPTGAMPSFDFCP